MNLPQALFNVSAMDVNTNDVPTDHEMRDMKDFGSRCLQSVTDALADSNVWTSVDGKTVAIVTVIVSDARANRLAGLAGTTFDHGDTQSASETGRDVANSSDLPDSASSDRRGSNVRLAREGDVWLLATEATESRLRHVIGFDRLATLLRSPSREFAAIELASACSGEARPVRHARDDGLHPNSSDLGPALDQEAVTQYRQRIVDLSDDLQEALAWSDLERATLARLEMDQISAELSRSVGLGGRGRPQSSDAERARVNVTKSLRAAIRRITSALPAAGEHLQSSVSTGRYCAYRPDPSSNIKWTVHA